ncbi:MAG: hypothetical protein QCH35_06600 [Methanomicrobiaceae archaeon]|nr:hypothetical protein [Methanomicrobiaceae archaeon]
MDTIEKGFSEILEKIEAYNKRKGELSREVAEHDAELLGRMAADAAPLIRSMGLNMMQMGKKDPKGEIYDAMYFPERMFVLGKTDPVPYRPDDPGKAVESQYCVLSDDGTFSEIMYSANELIIDSYRNRLAPREVIDIYGYDIMFMLYRAMRDYMKDEAELVKALEKTLEYVFQEK